jgi:hypothetical protein
LCFIAKERKKERKKEVKANLLEANNVTLIVTSILPVFKVKTVSPLGLEVRLLRRNNQEEERRRKKGITSTRITKIFATAIFTAVSKVRTAQYNITLRSFIFKNRTSQCHAR